MRNGMAVVVYQEGRRRRDRYELPLNAGGSTHTERAGQCAPSPGLRLSCGVVSNAASVNGPM